MITNQRHAKHLLETVASPDQYGLTNTLKDDPSNDTDEWTVARVIMKKDLSPFVQQSARGLTKRTGPKCPISL
jgi:hypothetical protein